MRRISISHLLPLILIVLIFSDAQPAYASGGEEAVKSWVAAIITVAGVGWFWHRTLRAADIYDVWYGTNRKNKIANTFDNEFGTEMSYGKCRVAIPKGHRFGSIGSSPLRRWIQRLFSGSDDKLEIMKLTPLAKTGFLDGIEKELASFDRNERAVLVYIHGFNTKFSEAAIRAAQIGFDLKIPGVMALYSWPSNADVSAYLADSDSIAASECYFVEFILGIAKAASDASINIVAHSMGNLGLLRSLTAGFADRRLDAVKFGQIFLAAPDIDVKLFRQLAYIYPLCSRRTTLYVSGGDRALMTSQLIHSNQRTGYSPPVTVITGIDTVEATNIDIGLLGHGYYADSASVLYDMAMLIRSNLAPASRPGLFRARTIDGNEYWVIPSRSRA